jgi:hypothetical protein
MLVNSSLQVINNLMFITQKTESLIHKEHF